MSRVTIEEIPDEDPLAGNNTATNINTAAAAPVFDHPTPVKFRFPNYKRNQPIPRDAMGDQTLWAPFGNQFAGMGPQQYAGILRKYAAGLPPRAATEWHKERNRKRAERRRNNKRKAYEAKVAFENLRAAKPEYEYPAK